MEEDTVVYCPRCNRPYANLELAKEHVAGQHPDHDPNWWDSGETE